MLERIPTPVFTTLAVVGLVLLIVSSFGPGPTWVAVIIGVLGLGMFIFGAVNVSERRGWSSSSWRKPPTL